MTIIEWRKCESNADSESTSLSTLSNWKDKDKSNECKLKAEEGQRDHQCTFQTAPNTKCWVLASRPTTEPTVVASGSRAGRDSRHRRAPVCVPKTMKTLRMLFREVLLWETNPVAAGLHLRLGFWAGEKKSPIALKTCKGLQLSTLLWDNAAVASLPSKKTKVRKA